MKIFNRLNALLLSLIIGILLIPVQTLAMGSIDLNHAHSLTVSAIYDHKPISEMQFDAYLISIVDQNGELKVTDQFRDYEDDLDIRGKNDSAWQEMAQILEQKILSDKALKPRGSAVTDAKGKGVFGKIPMGLYLIRSNGVEKDGYVYSTLPFFVLLPEANLSSNTWNYHVVANAKPGKSPVKADFEVIKIWKDEGYEYLRPKSITIELLRDGKVFNTITLPENGQWKHTWHDLDVNHKWTVREEKQPNYWDPDIRQEGNLFIVTNTCTKPGQPPKLPQTGLTWWPVPVLLSAGLLLVIFGVIRRRGSAHEE